MLREWAEIKSEALRAQRNLEEEQDPAEAQRLVDLLGGFVERHRQALLARGGDAAEVDPVRLKRKLDRFLKAEREYREVEDKLLSATADMADADRELTIQLLQALEQWEALPDSALEAMTPEQRAQGYEAFSQLKENRDSLCAGLPLELRREWGRRLAL